MKANVYFILSVSLLLLSLMILSQRSVGGVRPHHHHSSFPPTPSVVTYGSLPNPLFSIDTKFDRSAPFDKIGLLEGDGGKLLPLLGRRMSSQNYQYFTTENKDGMITNTPLFNDKGKSCTSEYGCGNVMSGDILSTMGNRAMTVRRFDNSSYHYV